MNPPLPSYADLLAARVADAIEHEAGSWRDADRPLSEGALQALRADLTDAQAHGDLERLSDLWRGLPAMAAELVSFEQERGPVLV